MGFKYDDLVGVPFKDGGRDKNGMDCWGLAIELFKRQGINLADYDISSESMKAVSDAMEHDLPLKWKKLERPEEGCLIAIRMIDAGWANHCGIYIGYGKFIHAYCKETGVVISRIRRWKARIVGYYLPGENAYDRNC